jgi:CIC family chloride channel protein
VKRLKVFGYLERERWAPPERLMAAPRLFYRSLLEFIRDLPGTAKRFWLLVIATGLASGLGAVVLLEILNAVQRWAWPAGDSFLDAVRGASPLRRVLVTVAAGLVVVLASSFMGEAHGGHGTASVIEAIWVRSGRLPFFRTLIRGIVSIIAVGLGAPLGREGALLQTGASTGSIFGQKLNIAPDQLRLLVACGAASGVAAAYNVPIGAALFGLEVLLGSFALELFGPIVVSCVVATLVSRILISDHPTYDIPDLKLLTPKEILLSAFFGPILGFASGLFIRVFNATSELLERVPKRYARLLPIAGMLPVGVAAIWLPQLLGNGYDSVNYALWSQLPLTLLLLLPVAKLFATSLCSATGIPGGLFTPTLFFGAMIGGALGVMAQYVWPGLAPSGAYALLGMGAALAGTTHASISAVLIIFELTGDYNVILPLMLCTVLATTASKRLSPDSLYTSVLRRRNIVLPESPRPQWLQTTTVKTLMVPNAARVPPSAKFDEIIVWLLELPAGSDLYVTTSDSKLLGTIVLDALKGHLPDHSLLKMTVAADVMDTSIAPVRPEITLAEVAARFAETSLEHLAVIDEEGHLLGTVSKAHVLKRGKF